MYEPFTGLSDRVPDVVESEDIGDLYKHYDSYVDMVKAQATKKK